MRVARAVGYPLLLVLAVVGAFIAGYLFHKHRAPLPVPILTEAYQVLKRHALNPLPPLQTLEYGMVRGMLESLDDPYTTFLEPPQNELESNRLAGNYGGIGADVEPDTQGYWVLYPFPEGPAAVAGIQDGDRLLSADQTEMDPDTPLDTVLSALRGPVGNQVKLKIGRPPDYTEAAYSIRLAEFPLPSVTWRIASQDPRLGIIQVNLIAASTGDEIQRAVDDLSGRGATHFVLDLRDNPGGLLDAGVDIARLFLSEGIVMEQQYRDREVEQFKVEKPGLLANIPLVVLINQGSASAAEIAAGAIQAQQRAVLIGAPSYGKDSIQLVFALQDESSLHVTAARWWIPGLERPVGDGGLQPDIPIDPAAAADGIDPFIEAAILEFFGRAQ